MSSIPPHGARIVGAWPNTIVRQERPARPERASRSAWLARLLHPLHRPVPERSTAAAGVSPAAQPPRHA